MKISLSDHFTYGKMLRFTVPSVVMMIFTSIYGVVDGFFVSNFVGKTPFAAVNLIMPVLMILGAVGLMFGAGGGALIARILGEGDRERANRLFSLFVDVTAGLAILLTVLSILLLPAIAAALGAEGQLLADCVLY
ncbi:MAG: MATE family efflux transporter, partial [Clostridium sp.]|nr:MATE family efflux transporter [Clostridium sp.]